MAHAYVEPLCDGWAVRVPGTAGNTLVGWWRSHERDAAEAFVQTWTIYLHRQARGVRP